MFNDIHASAATAARPKDSLGCLSSQLRQDLELDTGEFKFYRKCTLGSDTSPVAMDGSGRGFLIGVSLQTGHRRRIYSQHRWVTHEFERDCVYVRDFADDYRAELLGGFDFVLIELSRNFVSDACHERGGSGLARIATVAGRKDPVLGHLAQVLALTLDAQSGASPLFLEQLGVTIGTHLLDRYGEASTRSNRNNRGLSALQEARAKRCCSPDLRAVCPLKRSPVRATCRAVTSFKHFARPHSARRINGCWSGVSIRPVSF